MWKDHAMAQSHIPCNNMCNRDVHSLSVTSRNHPVAFPSSYNKCIYYCTGMKNNIFTLLMQLYSKAEYSCIMKNANDNNHEIWSFLLLNTRLKTRHSFQAKSVFHLCCCYFFFLFFVVDGAFPAQNFLSAKVWFVYFIFFVQHLQCQAKWDFIWR